MQGRRKRKVPLPLDRQLLVVSFHFISFHLSSTDLFSSSNIPAKKCKTGEMCITDAGKDTCMKAKPDCAKPGATPTSVVSVVGCSMSKLLLIGPFI